MSGRRSTLATLATVALSAALLLARAAYAEPPADCTPPTGRATLDLDGKVGVRTIVDWAAKTFCRPVVVPSVVLDDADSVELHPPGKLRPGEMFDVLVTTLRGLHIAVEEPAGAGRGPILLLPAPGFASSFQMEPAPRNLADPFGPDPVIGDRIQCDSDGKHCTIARSLVDHYLEHTAELAVAARFVPSVKEGKPNGFKLFALRPGSLFTRLGFQNGDTVTAVNGSPLLTPDQALAFYNSVRNAKKITFDVTRRGQPLQLELTIQ